MGLGSGSDPFAPHAAPRAHQHRPLEHRAHTRYVARMRTADANPLDGVSDLLDIAGEELRVRELTHSSDQATVATLARARSAYAFLRASLEAAPGVDPLVFHRAVMDALDRMATALDDWHALPLSPADALSEMTVGRLRAYADDPVASALLTTLPMAETKGMVVLVEAALLWLGRLRELAAGRVMLLANYARCVAERDSWRQLAERNGGSDPESRLALQVVRHLVETLHERFVLDGRWATIMPDEIGLLAQVIDKATGTRPRVEGLEDSPYEEHSVECQSCHRVIAQCWLAGGASVPVSICKSCSGSGSKAS